MRQREAANLQRNAALEFVRVPAVADASFRFQVSGFQSGAESLVVRHWSLAFAVIVALRVSVRSVKIRGRFYRFRKNSASSMSAGVVILIFRGEPITTDHFMSRALDQRSFVGAEKSVSRGFIECFLEHTVPKALRRLRHDHSLARHGCRDDSAFGCAFHLLDRVHGRHSGDGRAIFSRGLDDIVNDFAVTKGRTASCTRTMSSGAAETAAIALATDCWRCSPPSTSSIFLFERSLSALFQAVAKARDLVGPQGHINFRDLGTGRELAQGVNEDRRSANLGELFGRRRLLALGIGGGSHACPQAGRRNDDYDLHRGL